MSKQITTWICGACGKNESVEATEPPKGSLAPLPPGWVWQNYRSHRPELSHQISRALGCSKAHAIEAAQHYGDLTDEEGAWT
jgi:hypothetical protein